MNTIELHHICRVEGHGRLKVDIKENEVKNVELQIFEGARMFEAFLKGRKFDEISEITSRICGICSPAHTLTSLKAIEDAMGIELTEQTINLRKLLCMGGIIQSHALHVYLLALPDFLGYESAISMAGDYPNEIKNALKLKKLGNDIAEIVSGRAVHQISPRIGGFSKIPTDEKLKLLLKKLKELKSLALDTVTLFGDLDYGQLERKTEYIGLRSNEEYAFYDGEIVSSEKWEAPVKNYHEHIKERIMQYSTAKFGIRDNHGFFVGALPRLNLNFKQLSDDAKDSASSTDHDFPNFNPFLNNLAQAIEIVHCIDKSIEIIEDMKPRDEKNDFEIKEGEGFGATEAPRGTLYHHFKFNKNGYIEMADVITPTAQNLKNIEEDIQLLASTILDRPKEEIILELEKMVRAYDPCISCSTHFLELDFI